MEDFHTFYNKLRTNPFLWEENYFVMKSKTSMCLKYFLLELYFGQYVLVQFKIVLEFTIFMHDYLLYKLNDISETEPLFSEIFNRFNCIIFLKEPVLVLTFILSYIFSKYLTLYYKYLFVIDSMLVRVACIHIEQFFNS